MDTVSIRVPATGEYLRVVRLISAGVASRLAFTLEDIDDLKIAVDELIAWATGGRDSAGTLDVDFLVHGDHIEVRGRVHGGANHTVRADLTEFSRMIVDTVADEASLDRVNGIPTFTIVKRKSA